MTRISLVLSIALAVLAGRTTFAGEPQTRPSDTPVTIIFDTDLGNDVDDAMAMDMLYKYIDAGKANVIGIMTNRTMPSGPEMVDIMNTWYGYPKIPIGTISGGVIGDEKARYAERVCQQKDVDGKPMFHRSHRSYSKLLPSHELYRKLLASQPDNSVVIISVGFSTNLARLLESGPDKYSDLSGKELAEKKVKLLSVMAGDFVEEPMAEFNVLNIEISKLLFKDRFTLALKGYDLLNQAKNLSISDSSNYHTETWNNTLGRYAILSLTWRFGNMNNARKGMRGPGGPGPGGRGPMGPPPM